MTVGRTARRKSCVVTRRVVDGLIGGVLLNKPVVAARGEGNLRGARHRGNFQHTLVEPSAGVQCNDGVGVGHKRLCLFAQYIAAHNALMGVGVPVVATGNKIAINFQADDRRGRVLRVESQCLAEVAFSGTPLDHVSRQ